MFLFRETNILPGSDINKKDLLYTKNGTELYSIMKDCIYPDSILQPERKFVAN